MRNKRGMRQSLMGQLATRAAFWLGSVAAAVLLANAAQAQISKAPLVKAELIGAVETIQANQPFWLGLKLNITKGWHVYWQNPGDSGIPTEISWQAVDGLDISPIHWPLPERQPYSGLVNYGYSNGVVLPIAVVPAQDFANGVTLKARASWLVCKDICIPESADLSITLPKQDKNGKAALDAALAKLPVLVKAEASYSSQGEDIAIRFAKTALPEGAQLQQFFPIDDGIIQNASDQVVTEDAQDYVITAKSGGRGEKTGLIKGVVSYLLNGELAAIQLGAGDYATLVQPTPHEEETGILRSSAMLKAMMPQPMTIGVWLAVGLAFLGGVLLNLMPCVLPVVALKAFAIAKKGNLPSREIAFQGIAYTLGVLTTMVLLGVALYVLKSAGEAVGWGFQLQSPSMVVLLSLLMLLVGMFLLDWLTLPNLLTGVDQALGSKQGVSGSFFTGALSVAVATPCTAPFMAPALGAAAVMPPFHALLVLVSLGLGLAFPYLLISIWPPARKILPKPGVWMENFKQILAFPMFATSAWLLWVLVQLNGAFGLGYALTGIVLLSFAIWIYRRSTRRIMHILALAVAVLAMWYAIGKQPAMGDAVPTSHSVIENGVAEVAYSAEALAELRQNNVPVFVDATAAWCISCKVNEQVALRDSKVKAYFKEKNITVMVADWTARDTAISEYLAGFGRNGVPLYVWYAPGKEAVVLPQILTPSIVLDSLAF